VHTWLEFDAVVIIIIVVRTLGNVAGERRVAGLHSTLWFPLACLNAVLFHSRWPVNAMQLEIKTAGIADWLAHRIATPKRRHRCFAIAAREANAPRSRLRKHKIVIAIVITRSLWSRKEFSFGKRLAERASGESAGE